MKRIYALYKGDKWITDGTRKEIAEFIGVKPRTITYYMSNVHAKRGKSENRPKVIFIGYDEEMIK